MKSLLQAKDLKPTNSSDTPRSLPRVISLFSGAGGLDLGFKKAGYELVFAVDIDKWAVATHQRAFPGVHCIHADLVKLGVDGLLREVRALLRPGERIGVIGGPPCQGFSRSNVASRADDPRNKLPALYLEIVKALQAEFTVEFIVFENVLGILDKKHKAILDDITETLGRLGLCHRVAEYDAFDFGVPQHRRRVIIAAFQSILALNAFAPKQHGKGIATVGQAIGMLPEPYFFVKNMAPNPYHPNHWTMQPRSMRFFNPEKHAWDGRSFRRLDAGEPSPTVAYGHREIHVHPNGTRRLSIYEAMLLQGFPKKYVLLGPFSAQVEQVSNAVPPPLAYSLALAVRDSLAKT